MKNAILIATLLSLSTLAACSGLEPTNPPSMTGQHDDWSLLSASVSASADEVCQCITYGSRELLPDGCTAPRDAGALVAVRYCEFPQRSQIPGRNHCVAEPCYDPL